MPARLIRYPGALAALAASIHAANAAVAKTPTISGNGWVALGIIAFLIGTIWLLIMGALHVERRDAALGRSRRRADDGWFGFFPTDGEDDDSPDHHGYDGGEGGEGG